jgi:hypothetical protein
MMPKDLSDRQMTDLGLLILGMTFVIVAILMATL